MYFRSGTLYCCRVLIEVCACLLWVSVPQWKGDKWAKHMQNITPSTNTLRTVNSFKAYCWNVMIFLLISSNFKIAWEFHTTETYPVEFFPMIFLEPWSLIYSLKAGNVVWLFTNAKCRRLSMMTSCCRRLMRQLPSWTPWTKIRTRTARWSCSYCGTTSLYVVQLPLFNSQFRGVA